MSAFGGPVTIYTIPVISAIKSDRGNNEEQTLLLTFTPNLAFDMKKIKNALFFSVQIYSINLDKKSLQFVFAREALITKRIDTYFRER